VVIRSPLWKTPWFIILVALFIGAVIYLRIRNRINHIRQKANIDKLLSQTEMKALQAQMNPHFIFNSLNSIGEMILNNENKDASNYLSKFARLIRITLDQSSQSMVSCEIQWTTWSDTWKWKISATAILHTRSL
jgi:LytS/YehU family sensor histidine kinase